ncbi:MAG: M90 family metallopeptidase [Pseudomonadota bacterium]
MGLKGWLFGKGEPPGVSEADWQTALALPIFDRLDENERSRLRALAERLVREKTFSAAAGAEIDGAVCAAIAVQAVLPVLNLDIDSYGRWQEIIVYPAEFVPEREEMDEIGVVHHVRHPMSGEAWEGGPVVLSWEDVAWSGLCDGYNVVIHEFAHKLDMANGAANGLPRLHAGMRTEEWAAAFTSAYEDFCRRVDAGEETEIDPYAAENPAEFFAVLTEYFFELPEALHAAYPAVYEQMRRFFRQDPLAR